MDMMRDKLNLTQRASAYIRLHKKWRPYFCGYEKYGKDSDIQHIQYVQQEVNYRFSITPMGGTESKPDRIRKLIPIFEEHRMYFPKKMHKKIWDGTVIDMIDDFSIVNMICSL